MRRLGNGNKIPDTLTSANEIVSNRTGHGKMHNMGAGKISQIVSTRLMHVPDDPIAWQAGGAYTWEDCECFPDLNGSVINAWYNCDLNGIGFDYTSKRGGRVRKRLMRIGPVPVRNIPTPEILTDRVVWRNVAPGLDIELVYLPHLVAINKIMRIPAAMAQLEWREEISLDPGKTFTNPFSIGQDNFNRLPRNDGTDFITRPLEMEHAVGNSSRVGQFNRRTILERPTGFVLNRNPATRQKTRGPPVILPIWVDQDTGEIEISTDSDDGNEYASTWYANYAGGLQVSGTSQSDERLGCRWNSVAVANDQTLDTVTFRWRVDGVNGTGAPDPVLRAVVGDMPNTWADNNLPSGQTTTTENLAWSTWDTAENNSVAITAIGQEVIDNAGWASNDSFGLCTPASFAGDRQALIDDESSTRTSADPPTIQFQWTVAGGAAPKQRGFKTGAALGTVGFNVGGQLP